MNDNESTNLALIVIVVLLFVMFSFNLMHESELKAIETKEMQLEFCLIQAETVTDTLICELVSK